MVAVTVIVAPRPVAAQLLTGCFDPTGALCFKLLSLESVVESEDHVNWTIRTDASVQLFALRLPPRQLLFPLTPLTQFWLELFPSVPRTDGLSRTLTLVGREDGDAYNGQIVETSGVHGFRKGIFDFPLTMDPAEITAIELGTEATDGTVSTFNCKPAEDTCFGQRVLVPEPGPWLLIVTGLVGIAVVLRRRAGQAPV